MSDSAFAPVESPVAGAKIIYLGPNAPHWEIRATWGDTAIIDAFRGRVNARLLLLPKHDPQFRRNRERVNRDAERELIKLEWDLGDDLTESREPGPADAFVPEHEPVAEVVEEPVAVEAEDYDDTADMEPEQSDGDEVTDASGEEEE